jgi:hypothetical protein
VPPAGLKQGGARNRRDRQSWQLSEAQCRRLIVRSFDAWEAGQPLNRFVTLSCGKAMIPASEAVSTTGAFVSLARDWMNGHGFTMPWVWTQECGQLLGQHGHILLHVPPILNDLFAPMPRRWAKKLADGHYPADMIDTKRLDGASGKEVNPYLYKGSLMFRLHYMLKCAPISLESKLEMTGWGTKPWGQSSLVLGKRAAIWQRAPGGGDPIPGAVEA